MEVWTSSTLQVTVCSPTELKIDGEMGEAPQTWKPPGMCTRTPFFPVPSSLADELHLVMALIALPQTI